MGKETTSDNNLGGEYEKINKNIADDIAILEVFWQQNYRKLALFEARIAFYQVQRKENAERQQILNEFAIARKDTRQMFMYRAIEILGLVCKYDFDEQTNQDKAAAKHNSYDFHHFVTYNTPKEKYAKQGFEYVSTVGYVMKPKKDSVKKDDELHIRFVVPNHMLVGDVDPKEDEVLDWMESISEVFVEYTQTSDKGLGVETYVVSAKGSQSYPLPEVLNSKNLNDLTNPLKRQLADIKELKKLEKLYRRMKEMEPVSYATTTISIEGD